MLQIFLHQVTILSMAVMGLGGMLIPIIMMGNMPSSVVKVLCAEI
jgi:hypothetical protein